MQIITVLTPAKLRLVSREVREDEFGEDLDKHMDDMLELMYNARGVGLSGVQVGDARRIIVLDPGTGPIKIVNPEIIERSSEEVTYNEGCLSLPGLTATIERSKRLKIRYRTPTGELVEGEMEDPVSVIVQHEMEHLSGKTILDSMSWFKRDMYMKKLRKVVRKLKPKTKVLASKKKKKKKKRGKR